MKTPLKIHFFPLLLALSIAYGCTSSPTNESETETPKKENTAQHSPVASKSNIEKSNAVVKQDWLVQVGNVYLTPADLRESLNFKPIRSNSSKLQESVNARLDEMILATLLEQEARKQGIHNRPSVRQKIQQILTQELLSVQVEQPIHEAVFDESELKLYYDQNLHRYERPKQVRIADILIAIADDREAAKSKAEAVLKEALALQGKRSGFGPLVRKYSDTPLTYSKGDTGYFDPTGAPLLISESLVDAAFELQKVGQISPSLVEAEDGFHIIMLVGKRPPLKTSFSKVKHSIAAQIRKERLAEEHQFYLKQLRQNNPIQKDDDAIIEIVNQISDTSLYHDQASTEFPPQLPQ